MKLEDLTGRKFAQLTVVDRAENKKKKTAWNCICECGNKCVFSASDLKSGKVVSCGCYRRKNRARNNITHNKSKTRLYTIWCGMKQRCEYQKGNSYRLYGKRGIAICEQWHDFNIFYEWAMKNGYSDVLTLDRIDPDKGYTPSNCRWADIYVQANNTRKNKIIEFNGCKKTLAQWCAELGLNYTTIYARLYKLSWSVDKAFNTPILG